MIKIRKAKGLDYIKISDLMKELGYSKSIASIKKDVSKYNKNKHDIILVAEINKIVIGLIVLHVFNLFHKNGNCAIITSLVVNKQFRRLGVGSRLIEEAIKISKKFKCLRVELTSRSDRLEAHEFYKAIGFILLASKGFALELQEGGLFHKSIL